MNSFFVRQCRWLFILLPVFFACSTYFNTFYNAESSFDEGLAIHKKAMRSFPDSLVIEPPADARAKYDRAIEKSLKVLEVFPKDKKWHDDALFLLAKSYVYEKESVKAIRRVRQLQEEYPASPFIPESYVYLAMAYIADGQLDKAETTLRFALDRYPLLDKDQKISLLLVEIEIRHEGTSQAIARLEKARQSVKSPQKQVDLLLRVAELYMSMKQYDKAVTLLKSAPHDKKQQLQNFRIDRNLVSCYAAMDSLPLALALLTSMYENSWYVPYEREILFSKGSVLERQGKIDEAISAFKRIVETSDSTALQSDTSAVISKAWFALGRLYQKQKRDYAKAQNYYTLVTERNRDSAVTDSARGRMLAMKQITGLRAAIDSASKFGPQPEKRYSIGELFYYDLDEPDSAYTQFFAIAKDSVSDTGMTCKAFLAAANIMRYNHKDTVLSDTLYRELILRFPGTDYACKAEREMKIPLPSRTTAELAMDAFRAAEKLYLAGGDIKAAVQAYFGVYKRFPADEVAPKSLFVAAWITDTDLQKKKVAKSLYEKICKNYPQSIYCLNEAKPRIKVVLDTLDALRRLRAKTTVASPGTKSTAAAVPNDTTDDIITEPADTVAAPAADSLTDDKAHQSGDSINEDPNRFE
ncbi:MAG: tetratricopeptide repeat protein [Chitinispirillaceae bacterium]|jgi:tetratricopeptide (TPR) repeat protein|nr:tetratricopeptide repeat protein [Chitinispirillaceae bacterium]